MLASPIDGIKIWWCEYIHEDVGVTGLLSGHRVVIKRSTNEVCGSILLVNAVVPHQII